MAVISAALCAFHIAHHIDLFECLLAGLTGAGTASGLICAIVFSFRAHLNSIECKREFNSLFQELTGMRPEESEKNSEGYALIPLTPEIESKSKWKVARIKELSGNDCFFNRIYKKPIELWVKPPSWP